MDLSRETVRRLRGLILFAVVAVIVGVHYQDVLKLLSSALSIISPFLLGGVLAFVLNLPMRAIERHLPGGLRARRGLARAISLVLALLFVFGIVALVIVIVVPQLGSAISDLQKSIPEFFTNLKTTLPSLLASYPEVVDWINSIDIDWKSVLSEIVSFLTNGAGSVVSSAVSAVFSIVSSVATFVIALVFGIYVLAQKETLARQTRRLTGAFLPEKFLSPCRSVLALISDKFSKFITGQCLEAMILGSMFVVAMSIFRLPYAMLIGVLVAFTALIPIFGAFIGCVIGAFLILTVNPMQAVYFVILFLVLQQIEGKLIYPHVVGGSVGLPSIWVLVAVTVGGSMFGVAGMLLFIPTCSVLYTLLRDAVNRRSGAPPIEEETPPAAG